MFDESKPTSLIMALAQKRTREPRKTTNFEERKGGGAISQSTTVTIIALGVALLDPQSFSTERSMG